MKLTNNLKDDLSQAPSWFRESIEKPHKNKILKDIKGAIHYSVWNDRDHIKKIVVFTAGDRSWHGCADVRSFAAFVDNRCAGA